MRRTVLTFLLLLFFLLLLAAGALTYLYSDGGNARIRTYLEQKIQKQTRLPITFKRFKLSRGHLYFIAVMGREASLGFDGRFDLFSRRLNGRYLLKASHAHYQKYTLRQANISGQVHGDIDALKLDGKGTLLDGLVAFKLSILKQIPQDIVVQLRKLPLDELLTLGGQPPIVQGQLNADVMLPSIGKQGSKGHALIQLAEARFDPVLIRKLYHYTLPTDQTTLHGQLRADLEGEQVAFAGDILSELISIHIKNGQGNITDKSVACDMAVASAELAPVTQNRLHGPFKLAGSFKYDELGTQVRAHTGSLGGTIVLNYTKAISATIKDVSLSRVLHLVGEPDDASGNINGTLTLATPRAQSGHYVLKVTDGTIHSATLNRHLGTSLPAKALFRLDSEGTLSKGLLKASTRLRSNLLEATLTKTRFDLATQALDTRYRLHIPNPLLLAGQKGKGVPVTLDGTIARSKTLHIRGKAKGLGDQLRFDYSGTQLKMQAKKLMIERLLSSAGLPMYVSGKVDATVNLSSLNPLQGTVALYAPHLTTHPSAMQRLIGKPLGTSLSLAVSAQAKKGIVFGKGKINGPLATLLASKFTYNVKHKVLTTPFDLSVPDLAKLSPLIGTKLNGSFATTGTLKTGKQIDLSGTSTSLGGQTTYRYRGTRLDAKMQGVTLSKLLPLIDQPDAFLGTANGTLLYDTLSRKGQAHVAVDRFQFKPGKLTRAVTLVLHKDLAQIIYDRTTADARFNGDWIAYRLKANGRRSDFVIKDGKLNTQARTNKASFGLRIDNVDVIGTIRGSIHDPKISVLPGRMLRNRLKKKVIDTVAPKVKDAIKKNVGGAAGSVLKNLPKLF